MNVQLRDITQELVKSERLKLEVSNILWSVLFCPLNLLFHH
jgi:hypothetical protein